MEAQTRYADSDGVSIADRRAKTLKGAPGEWHLFAVD